MSDYLIMLLHWQRVYENTLNGKITNSEQKGGGRGLFKIAIPAFAWSVQVRPRKSIL
jgi:hypothetical protein